MSAIGTTDFVVFGIAVVVGIGLFALVGLYSAIKKAKRSPGGERYFGGTSDSYSDSYSAADPTFSIFNWSGSHHDASGDSGGSHAGGGYDAGLGGDTSDTSCSSDSGCSGGGDSGGGGGGCSSGD